MNKPFFLFAFLCLSCQAMPGRSQQFREVSITQKGLLSDLDAYRDGIVKYHIDPYSVISHRELNAQIDALKLIADTIDTDDLLVRLLQVNALIADGHTNISIQTRDIFPFYIQHYEEGYYIIATNDENRKYYHTRILAVNGIPIADVQKRLTTIVSEKNKGYATHMVSSLLVDPVVLHGLHISARRDSVVYTVLTPQGITEQVRPRLIDVRTGRDQVTGFKSDKFLRTAQRGRYWFKYIDTSNTIYFNYRSCLEDGSFQQVIRDLERTINEKQPKKIIIDIRYNSGGSSSLLDPFIRYLSKSSLNTKGGIFVLIGPKTYSSAVLNAFSLRTKTKAIFVGEETGEQVDHFGELKFFFLPETNLKVSYSTKHFTFPGYHGPVLPDHVVPETFAEYDHDIDSVLQYALNN